LAAADEAHAASFALNKMAEPRKQGFGKHDLHQKTALLVEDSVHGAAINCLSRVGELTTGSGALQAC